MAHVAFNMLALVQRRAVVHSLLGAVLCNVCYFEVLGRVRCRVVVQADVLDGAVTVWRAQRLG
eukprot:467669-Amphidinium_carterae.1